jgi:limonene-1,2-epoxide hydrolase
MALEAQATSALDVVFQFFHLWNTGLSGDALVMLSDDVVYDRVTMSVVMGSADVAALFRDFGIGTIYTVAWQITSFAVNENVVFTERVDVFRHENGGAIVLPVMGTLTVVDERISVWRDYFDVASFKSQLAAVGARTRSGGPDSP